MPFAQGFTARDAISTVNAVRNLDKITKPGVREEVITEAKNILQSIQHGGKVQR